MTGPQASHGREHRARVLCAGRATTLEFPTLVRTSRPPTPPHSMRTRCRPSTKRSPPSTHLTIPTLPTTHTSQTQAHGCCRRSAQMGQNRHLTLRRAGRCAICDDTLAVGEVAWWDAERRVVECGACHPEVSVAGESAQREGERRLANRDRRTLAQHRLTGGLRMALTEAPSHETAWGKGAQGERRVGAMLDKVASTGSIRVASHLRASTISTAG